MPTVHVCDDNYDSHFALRTWFQGQGFEVQSSEELGAAITAVSTQPPALVVARIEGFSRGFGLCNRIRHLPATKTIPVILLASDTFDDVIEQHANLKCAANAYVRLPFDPDEFLQIVSTLVPTARRSG